MNADINFKVYQNWNIWLPVGIGLLIIVLTIAVVISSLVRLKSDLSSQHRIRSTNIAFYFAKLFLQDSLQKNKRSSQVTLFDGAISSQLVIFLSTIAPVVFILAFFTFWSVFLFRETFSCDPKLHCFLQNPTTFVIANQPLPNCSTTNHENNTIICFQLVLDYTAGFAAMGGVFAAAVVLLQMYSIFLVWLKGLRPSLPLMKMIKFMCSGIFWLVPIICGSIILIIAFFEPTIRKIFFQNDESTLLFAVYLLALLYVGPVAGVCTLKAAYVDSHSDASLHQHTYDKFRNGNKAFQYERRQLIRPIMSSVEDVTSISESSLVLSFNGRRTSDY